LCVTERWQRQGGDYSPPLSMTSLARAPVLPLKSVVEHPEGDLFRHVFEGKEGRGGRGEEVCGRQGALGGHAR